MNLPSFFAELKRRNVYKVAVAYAVVGWLLIQAASIVLPTFDAPGWTMKILLVALAIGFPIAVVLAWAFEITPEGIVRAEEVVRNESITAHTGRKLVVLTTALAMIAAGLMAWQWWVRVPVGDAVSFPPKPDGKLTASPTTPRSLPIAEKSIAVLPFENLSDDKTNGYFADGIQDEILTRLAKIADLKVISRTSTQRFKSSPNDLPAIAKQLGVLHILEGSVQKAGESVRVNVQLIRAEGDSHLWAETYDRKLTDIFAVESEVAQRIAGSLEAKLTGHEKEAVNYVGTKIPAAYDAYLRGLALRNTQTPEDQDRMIKYCREAVALDPNYAAAWSDLALAEGLKFIQGERTEAQRALVQAAAENALRLDPERGSGHAAMGTYFYYCLQDYEKALVELQTAREQDPHNPLLLQAIGLVKRRQGKLEESIELQLQAAQTDPLNQDIWVNLGWSYRGQRRLPEARAMLERARAIAPNDTWILGRQAEAYLAEGNLEEASRILQPLSLDLETPVFLERVETLVFARKFDEAIASLTDGLAKGTKAPPFWRAAAHFVLGALHKRAGRESEAQSFLLQAETKLSAVKEGGNKSPDVRRFLLLVHAALGRRDLVERDAREHVALEARDRWAGPAAEADVAQAYAMLGDRERALALLERLMVEPSANALTPAYLRMDPAWDAIRDDPRFQKLARSVRASSP